jgi:hypothetical protein
MTAYQLNSLIQIGAGQRVRAYLKTLSLKVRLPLLHELIPYITESQGGLKFFHEHFAQEIGALLRTKYNYDEAERLYNSAKGKISR